MQRMTHVLSRMLNDPMTRAALNIGGEDPESNQETHSSERHNTESTIDEGEGGSGTLHNFDVLLSESGEEATSQSEQNTSRDRTNLIDVPDVENSHESTTFTSGNDGNGARSGNDADESSTDTSNNDR